MIDTHNHQYCAVSLFHTANQQMRSASTSEMRSPLATVTGNVTGLRAYILSYIWRVLNTVTKQEMRS